MQSHGRLGCSARGVLCGCIRLDARGVVQPRHPRCPRVPLLWRNHVVAHRVVHGLPCPHQVHGVGGGGYLLKAALRLGICHLDHQSPGVAARCLTACSGRVHLLPTGVPMGPAAPPWWLVLAWCSACQCGDHLTVRNVGGHCPNSRLAPGVGLQGFSDRPHATRQRRDARCHLALGGAALVACHCTRDGLGAGDHGERLACGPHPQVLG